MFITIFVTVLGAEGIVIGFVDLNVLFGFKQDLHYRKLRTFVPLFRNFSINHHVSRRPCWSEATDPVQRCKEPGW